MASKKESTDQTVQEAEKVRDQYTQALSALSDVADKIKEICKGLEVSEKSSRDFKENFKELEDHLKDISGLYKNINDFENGRNNAQEKWLATQKEINAEFRAYVDLQQEIIRQENAGHSSAGTSSFQSKLLTQIRNDAGKTANDVLRRFNVSGKDKLTIKNGYKDLISDEAIRQDAIPEELQNIYTQFIKYGKDHKLSESESAAAKALRAEMNKYESTEQIADYQAKLEQEKADREHAMTDSFGLKENMKLKFGQAVSISNLQSLNNQKMGAYEKTMLSNQNKIDELVAKREEKGLSNQETTELSSLQDENAALSKKFMGTKFWSGILDAFKRAKELAVDIADVFKQTTGISLSIKENFKSVLSDISNMLDETQGVASYDTTSSYFTNATARSQQIKYGLDSSSNWAFTEVKSLLGINTDTDIAFMNDNQREMFTKYMEKYTEMYDQMSYSGALTSIQEMQLEFAVFKKELSVKFLSWVADNKDLILNTATGLINFMEKVMNAMASILTWIGASSSTSYSDYVGYSGSATRASAVSINTTVNVSGTSDDASLTDSINNATWQSAMQASQLIRGNGG